MTFLPTYHPSCFSAFRRVMMIWEATHNVRCGSPTVTPGPTPPPSPTASVVTEIYAPEPDRASDKEVVFELDEAPVFHPCIGFSGPVDPPATQSWTAAIRGWVARRGLGLVTAYVDSHLSNIRFWANQAHFFSSPEVASEPTGVLPRDYLVDRDASGQGVVPFEEGGQGYTPLSVHATRPRRRALWVRRLEMYLGGELGCVGRFLRGQWKPTRPAFGDDVALNLLLVHFRHGAKCLGGGTVQTLGDEEVNKAQTYVVIELADGSRHVVFLDLFFTLASYAFLRERSAVLVSSLKTRALEWCKKVGLSKVHTWIAVSNAVHLAWQISPRERYAAEAISLRGESRLFWWSGR